MRAIGHGVVLKCCEVSNHKPVEVSLSMHGVLVGALRSRGEGHLGRQGRSDTLAVGHFRINP